MIRPESFDKRIPSYRIHTALGATYEAIGDMAAVSHYAEPDAEEKAVHELAFADLNALPRCGFKSEGAPEWLARQGIVIPDAANKAARQKSGGLCLRLGATDMLVAGSPLGDDDGPSALLLRWSTETVALRGWDAHREEGFSWFVLTGEHAPELLSRRCSVNLHPEAFANLSVSQTTAFGMGGVIARADISRTLAYHMFFDIASSDHLIEVVQEDMEEFGGRLVGLSALRALG